MKCGKMAFHSLFKRTLKFKELKQMVILGDQCQQGLTLIPTSMVPQGLNMSNEESGTFHLTFVGLAQRSYTYTGRITEFNLSAKHHHEMQNHSEITGTNLAICSNTGFIHLPNCH